MSEKLIDSFEVPSNSTWKFNESTDESSVVDGTNILGRCVGPFFAVDADSLNKRHYSRALWERAISENSERLEFGEMLGTIGHDQPLDDQALLEGKASHRVSKLWIDEATGAGMGEILILNSSSGRELNALLRGGVRLKVSSRALGEYKGKTKSGSNIIDEATFNLKGFDFVQTPGVSTAIPVLVESTTEQQIIESDIITEPKMDHLEKIMTEKVKLEESFNQAVDKNTALTNENSSLNKLVESQEAQLKTAEISLTESAKKLEEAEVELSKLRESVAAYESIGGSAEELKTKISESEALLTQYLEFGKPEQLTEAFDKVTQIVEDFKELGTFVEIEEVFDRTRQYAELGSISSITKGQELLQAYENLGSQEDLTAKLELLAKYEDLGTPEEIATAFQATDETLATIAKTQHDAQVKSFSEAKGVTLEVAESLITKHGVEEAGKLLESLQIKRDISQRYSVSEQRQKTTEPKPTNENLNEGKPEVLNPAQRSRSLMERLSK